MFFWLNEEIDFSNKEMTRWAFLSVGSCDVFKLGWGIMAFIVGDLDILSTGDPPAGDYHAPYHRDLHAPSGFREGSVRWL
jgi:hypothetical protein